MNGNTSKPVFPGRSSSGKWKKIIAAIAMVLLVTVPSALLIIGSNQQLRYYYSLWSSNLAIPPAVASTATPYLKFYGNRNNNEFAMRIEHAASDRFALATGVETEVFHPTQETRLQIMRELLNSKSSEFDAIMIDIIWVGELARHFIDLKIFFDEEIKSHDQTIIENSTIEEKFVAVPWFQNIGLLFYRKDLLEKYDLRLPHTWEELEEAAAKIQSQEKNNISDFMGFSWQGAPYEGLTCNALEWIASWGALDPNTGLPLFGDEGVLDALDRARTWVNGENAISFDARHHMEEESLQMFLEGKVAFRRGWSNEYAILEQSGIEFGVAPLPRGSSDKNFAVLGGWQLAVPKYSRNQRSAIEFVRYLTSPEVQTWRAEVGAFQPTIETVDVQKALPFLNDNWFINIQRIIRPSSRLGSHYNSVSECIYKGVSAALNRNSRAEIQQDIDEMENCIERKSKVPPITP